MILDALLLLNVGFCFQQGSLSHTKPRHASAMIRIVKLSGEVLCSFDGKLGPVHPLDEGRRDRLVKTSVDSDWACANLSSHRCHCSLHQNLGCVVHGMICCKEWVETNSRSEKIWKVSVGIMSHHARQENPCCWLVWAGPRPWGIMGTVKFYGMFLLAKSFFVGWISILIVRSSFLILKSPFWKRWNPNLLMVKSPSDRWSSHFCSSNLMTSIFLA